MAEIDEYGILIEADALADIQQGITYYEERQKGLGVRFEAQLNVQFESLKINPFYQIRYDQVHCLPVTKFPFMIHFTIDELNKQVIIRAVFHTSLDPKKWDVRK